MDIAYHFGHQDSAILTHGHSDEIPYAPAAALPVLEEALAGIASDADQVSVTAGYVYDRKGYESVDLFGQSRNRSYGRKGDDIMIQVTYRVSSHTPTYKHLLEVDAHLEDANRDAVRREAALQYEAARAAVLEAQAAYIAAGGKIPDLLDI